MSTMVAVSFVQPGFPPLDWTFRTECGTVSQLTLAVASDMLSQYVISESGFLQTVCLLLLYSVSQGAESWSEWSP